MRFSDRKTMGEKHRTISVFVPHMGCPNHCSFCNQKKITGVGTTVTPQMVTERIEQHLETIDGQNAEIEVGFFGGSFTAIPQEEQTALLRAAYPYVEQGKLTGIRLSTRPDCITPDILNHLKSYGVTTIELGVQSMDNGVLQQNFRGHTAEDACRASEMIHSFGFALGHQVMIGLPGDTAEKALATVDTLLRFQPEDTRIYPTLVIRDTLLARWYREGLYQPLTLDEAVELSKEILKKFRAAGTNVIRIGLLGSDTIHPQQDVLAGPFHPAFGELTESELVYETLSEQLKQLSGKRLQIAVHPHFVSQLVGCKKKNIKRLSERFLLETIQIVQDETIKIGEWRMLCI